MSVVRTLVIPEDLTQASHAEELTEANIAVYPGALDIECEACAMLIARTSTAPYHVVCAFPLASDTHAYGRGRDDRIPEDSRCVVFVVILVSLVYDAIMSLYKYSLRLSLCCDRIMPPRPMNQATIERLITERVTAAVEAERQRQGNARGQGNNEAGGQGGAPAARECTFLGFMKCNPTVFHGHEGAVELSRWFEKTEMVFGISECTEARKVKFAAATLQGRALTWWNSQVAMMGLEAANQIGWTEMRRLMTEEFCPVKEGTVIGSKPTNLNEAVRMAHALMEQKAQARIERIAEGNKRKWESSQGGNKRNNRNNNRDNTRHNQQNNQRQGNARAMTTAPAEQVIGMDWLVDQDAVIVCGKKVVHIPVKNKTLIVEGDRGTSRLKIISCIKANKYIERGHQLFVAHVTEKEPKEKHLKDVPVIRDFPKVFPDDLQGLPPPRQVEFKIELVPGAAPVARAPYRLAPSEMKEVADQLQELLEKGFIRPSSSP
ncbi:hypothetical protein Tco_0189439 [Tanacetum coccineum]